MIVVGERKCRFCDAIFDETLHRAGEEKEKTPAARPLTMMTISQRANGSFHLRPEIGLLGSLIYFIMRKPKALKVLGVSAVIFVIHVFIGIAIAMSRQPH